MCRRLPSGCCLNVAILDGLYTSGRLTPCQRELILAGGDPSLYGLSAYDLQALTCGRLQCAAATAHLDSRRSPVPQPGARMPARVSTVTARSASTPLLLPSGRRSGFLIKNDSAAVLFVRYGGTASPTDYSIDLQPGDKMTDELGYAGQVEGAWSFVDGQARITEVL